MDEYQDLNRCDLAVVKHIESRGVELFIAGDDDQSIYGFRKAHPDGIRRFPQDFSDVSQLELDICKRCDQDILGMGLFVAEQDPRRVAKSIHSDEGAARGEVAILRFDQENEEAKGIAEICANLIRVKEYNPGDILILLRADRNGVFSNVLKEKLATAEIPVSSTTEPLNPLETESGRTFLSFMQLAARLTDSLAWRSLFDTWCEGIGPAATMAVYDLARSQGGTYAESVLAAHENPAMLPSSLRTRLSKAIKRVVEQLDSSFPQDKRDELESSESLMAVLESAAKENHH